MKAHQSHSLLRWFTHMLGPHSPHEEGVLPSPRTRRKEKVTYPTSQLGSGTERM
jgi:hypothetical protein